MFEVLRKALIRQLEQACQVDGSCPTLISPDPLFVGGSRTSLSSFFHGVMRSAIETCPPDPVLDRIKDRWTELLKRQIGPNGSVNYWLRESEDARLHPYPDDFDSTSCVLAALAVADPASLTGERLARLVLLLTSCEVAEGGPYRTWIIGEDAAPVWKDVDLLVNANIAYFLSTQDVHLKPLERFLSEKIRAGEYTSPYYPFPIPAFYFLSRVALREATQKLKDDIFAQQSQEGDWGSVSGTAMALTSLLRLGVDVASLEPGMRWFVSRLESACPAEPFCLDSVVGGTRYFAGSEALTAAFCLETLAHVERAREVAPIQTDSVTPSVVEEVSHLLETFAASLPSSLSTRFTSVSQNVLGDVRGQEIPALPMMFANVLKREKFALTQDQLAWLGAANVYGWIAYTIFDDFLDEEGSLPLLPVAMACLRQLEDVWHLFGSRWPLVPSLAKTVMDKMDAANAWEVSSCRLEKRGSTFVLPVTLPDFRQDEVLAERSFGHALGPLVVLIAEGYLPECETFCLTEEFFRHYLIARQLDDDAHDWEVDLQRGQLNRVGTQVLRMWRSHVGERQELHQEDMKMLRELFWGEVILSVAEDILKEVARAEQALAACEAIHQKEALARMLVPMRTSAELAMAGHERTRSFLAAYTAEGTNAPKIP